MSASVKPKDIILCADDFGFTKGISRGILELIQKKRLSATSCMVAHSSFKEFAFGLKNYQNSVDIGLHFDLTSSPSTSFAQLVKATFLGNIDQSFIRNEFRKQVNQFIAAFGFAPAFVDGHHHVHQLPQISGVILNEIHQVPGLKKTALRNCWESPLTIYKRGVSIKKAFAISSLGRSLKKQCRTRNILTNNGFSGIYDFDTIHQYSELFERFSDNVKSKTLIMCHPGYVDDELISKDSLVGSRRAELDYFSSAKFKELLERKSLRLGRFGPTNY